MRTFISNLRVNRGSQGHAANIAQRRPARELASILTLALGLCVPLKSWGNATNSASARFRDQNDMGCHMAPGAAGAPASGAAGAGGNQANCPPCQSAAGISRWWVNSPYENLH